MPRYRLREFHKHYHMGQRYEGHRPGKSSEFPDVIELDEERAERIMNKLIPLSGPHAGEPEPEKEAPETAPEEVSAVAPKEAEQAPEDSVKEEEAPASDSVPTEEPADESPSLTSVHLGAGKWDVMQGDKKVNDVPLSEDEAKALVDGVE